MTNLEYRLDYEVAKLSNGLKVSYRQLDTPDVVFTTRVNEGSIHEPEGKRGILHLIEHLFYRTTDGSNLKRTLFEITGRDVPDAHTHPEQMVFSARMPYQDFTGFLNVWSDAVKRTEYSDEGFQTEKKIVLSEIAPEEIEGNILHYSLGLRRNNLYPNHILGLTPSGSTDEVSRLTPKDIDEYKRERINASNITLTAVGGFDKTNLIDQLEHYFGNIPSGQKNKILQSNVPVPISLEEQKRFPGVPYQTLNMMFQTPGMMEEDTVFLFIMREYLAGGLSARLTNVLREKEGMVYSVSMHSGTELMNPDIWSIIVQRFDEDNYNKLVSLIKNELDRLKEGEIDQELLRINKQSYLKKFWQNNLQGLGSQTENIDLREGKGIPYSLERIVEIWDEVTEKDISRVAQRVFNGNYVTIGVYPASS